MNIPVAHSPENIRRRVSKFGSMPVFVYFLILESVQAQSTSTGQDLATRDVASSFQASLAVVISVLSIMFLLTFILVVYAKFCHHPTSSSNQNRRQITRSNSRFSGIDKKLIESLPFFKFSALKGAREGLECAVCLSKFEEIEILRLLPKCKHAFHINCVDLWLEKHSSCPLCRQRIHENDLNFLTYSNTSSLRFPRTQSDLGDPSSNIEIFVERSESQSQRQSQSQTHHGSSRFGSFRRFMKFEREEEIPIQKIEENNGYDHKIIVSEIVLQNRWSNLSSSDLVYLNSEMVNITSSDRFSNIERFDTNNTFSNNNSAKIAHSSEKRSKSEIVNHPRFSEFGTKTTNIEVERKRKLWLPIARRTLEWFASREKRDQQTTKVSLNV